MRWSTVMDWMVQNKGEVILATSATTTFPGMVIKINLIDTPEIVV